MDGSSESSNQSMEQLSQTDYLSNNPNADQVDNNSDGSDDESVGSSDDDGDDNDVDEEDDTVCPICLGELIDQMVAIPENCMHMFCADCLQEWAKNVNTCPVDRRKFNSISILQNKDGTVLEEVHVDDKEITDKSYEEPPTYCEVCGSCDREESLLLCDECDQGYHLDCLNPPLHSVPIDEWYCTNCRPTQSNTNRKRSKEEDQDSNVLSEDDMMQIYERTRAQNIDSQARSFLFGQVTGNKARTVASSRGRNSSRRGARRRGTSRSTSGSQRRNKKSNKNKNGKSKDKSKKIQKSLESAKKKMIKEQLRKFREKMSDESEVPSVSLYGKALDLNEFYGDFEEIYSSQPKSPPRSTLVNTTDVVGSILGGFGTLDPDNLVVLQDGTLIKKEAKQNEDNVRNFNKENFVADTNEKRRKIRFHEEETTKQMQNSTKKCKIDSEKNIEHVAADLEFIGSEENIDNNKSSLHNPALKEILKKRYLEKMSEKLKAKEFDERLKSMRTERHNEEQKLASFQSVSKFKIPKLKTASNDSELENVSLNNKFKMMEEQNLNNLSNVIHDKKPTDNRKKLNLEQKIELHRKGKLEANIKRSHPTSTRTGCNNIKSDFSMIKRQKCSTTSTLTTKVLSEIEKSRMSSSFTTDPNVQKLNLSCTKTLQANKSSCLSNTSHYSLKKEKQAETTVSKKSLSIDDYQNRKLYEELFGDADLEMNLKMPLKEKTKKVTFADCHDQDKVQSDQLSLKKSKHDVIMPCLNVSKSKLQMQTSKVNRSASINTSPSYSNFTEIMNRPISIKRNRTEAKNSLKKEFWESPKRDLPVAVVTPSPRLDHDDSDVMESFIPSNRVKSSIHSSASVNADQSSAFLGVSLARLKSKTDSLLMLKELNSSTSKRKKTPEEASIISKIKSILKPYYAQKVVTKEQWKDIVKRTYKKVTCNVDYYMSSGRIENLIGQYVKRYSA